MIKIEKKITKKFKTEVEFVDINTVKAGKLLLPMNNPKAQPFFNMIGFESLIKEMLTILGDESIN